MYPIQYDKNIDKACSLFSEHLYLQLVKIVEIYLEVVELIQNSRVCLS